jgi:hypothetical protein
LMSYSRLLDIINVDGRQTHRSVSEHPTPDDSYPCKQRKATSSEVLRIDFLASQGCPWGVEL